MSVQDKNTFDIPKLPRMASASKKNERKATSIEEKGINPNKILSPDNINSNKICEVTQLELSDLPEEILFEIFNKSKNFRLLLVNNRFSGIMNTIFASQNNEFRKTFPRLAKYPDEDSIAPTILQNRIFKEFKSLFHGDSTVDLTECFLSDITLIWKKFDEDLSEKLLLLVAQIFGFTLDPKLTLEEKTQELSKYIHNNLEQLLDNELSILLTKSYVPEKLWDILVPFARITFGDGIFARQAENISKLIHLKRLYIMNGSLESIPEHWENCTNLDTLGIIDAKLGKLPSNIWNCPSLTTLILSGSQLKEFPPVLTDDCPIERLYFKRNEITHFPEGFERLKKLRKISLNGNPVLQNREEMKKVSHLKIVNY